MKNREECKYFESVCTPNGCPFIDRPCNCIDFTPKSHKDIIRELDVKISIYESKKPGTIYRYGRGYIQKNISVEEFYKELIIEGLKNFNYGYNIEVLVKQVKSEEEP